MTIRGESTSLRPETNGTNINVGGFEMLPQTPYSLGGDQGVPPKVFPMILMVRATEALKGNVEDPDSPSFELPADKKSPKATVRIGVSRELGFAAASTVLSKCCRRGTRRHQTSAYAQVVDRDA